MCNLYSITKGQAAIGAFTRAMRDLTGNLPPMPGVFPDYPAPIVRNGPDGVRELMLARWGMPGPPQFGGAPITNIRNTASPHWRGCFNVGHRCVVPFNSFCEYADTKPRKTRRPGLRSTKTARSPSSLASGPHGTARVTRKPTRSRASISSLGS
jgi:putative SOS response-associated peptidase YedK